MAQWNYNPDDYSPQDFPLIPVGDHRVRIAEVTEKKSSKGNDMYEITLDVSGYNGKLWYYLVLMPDNAQQTNQNIGRFFNCFGIAEKHLGTGKQWEGKVGAVRVQHEEYNGETGAKIKYLVNRDKQDKLPPWKEPEKTGAAATKAPSNAPSFQSVVDSLPTPDDEELPF